MAKKYTVVHKKSNVIVNGEPKLPSASTLEYGEIAVNYAVSGETLSIKNAANEVIPFASKPEVERMIEGSGFATSDELASAVTELNQAMVDDEEVIATALNDLNGRIENIHVPTSVSELNNDSGFITSADTAHTHTAAEVGAMATSERSNYLPTGTTLDNVADGTTRKLSNYSTTAHTHSQYSTTAHTHTAEEVGAMATSERGNYLTTATTIPNVDNYFDDAEYDSNTKRINFKHGATVKDYIDATDFIKDGMVSSVTVSNGNLVITFNTDAGREDITLALTEIFNPNNYYTKTDADGKFLTGYTETDPTVPAWAKAASKPTYTASEVGAMATSERSNYSTTAHTHEQYALTSHTHTAAEVGAMATSERGNYLTTATTIPTEASIEASGFTKNALTGYTETDPTVPSWAKAASKPSYTAAEVGAMATSERSNYATTAHTHTAEEVGAMATSERGNYLTTATTIPTEASIEGSGFTKNAITAITMNGNALSVTDGRVNLNGVLNTYSSVIQDGMPVTSLGGPVNFSNLNIINGNDWSGLQRASSLDSGGAPVSPTSLQDDLDAKASTAHTHTAAEVGAMATSERSNYSTTAHTHSQYATTAHTHDYLPLSGGDVTGDVYLIEKNNEWIHTQLTEFSIKFVSGNTGNRNVSLYPYWKEGQVIGTGDKLFLPNKSGTLATTDDIPTESDLTSSGFTKNAITGINVNGTAATITNGVAEINVQGGGGSTLPSVTAADNGKVLMVVNGAWAVVMPTTVYTGTDTPLSSIGNDGDIYLQTS